MRVIILCAALGIAMAHQTLRAEGVVPTGCAFAISRSAKTNDLEQFRKRVLSLKSAKLSVREITGHKDSPSGSNGLIRQDLPQLPVPPEPIFREYQVPQGFAADLVAALLRARPQVETDHLRLQRAVLVYLGDNMGSDEKLVLEVRGNQVTIDMSSRQRSSGDDKVWFTVPGLDELLGGVIRNGGSGSLS